MFRIKHIFLVFTIQGLCLETDECTFHHQVEYDVEKNNASS